LKLASSAPTKARSERGRVRRVARHHERPAHLSEDLVRHTHHGRARDLRVASEEILDLGRVDVEAAADEHLALPPAEVEVAGVVEEADVARVHPALGVDGGRSGLGSRQ